MAMTDRKIVCKRLANVLDWMVEQEMSGYIGRYTLKRQHGEWKAEKSK